MERERKKKKFKSVDALIVHAVCVCVCVRVSGLTSSSLDCLTTVTRTGVVLKDTADRDLWRQET